jgi:predicted nucleotidyltransferase
LKRGGIVLLSLFGSVARGDAHAGSDVDLMAEFDAAEKFTILGRVHLENRIVEVLGMKGDLAHRAMLRGGVLESATRKAVAVLRDSKLCFRDIFDAIEQFTAGMNFEHFRSDPKTITAVKSEAASDYPWLLWHDIRGIGNGCGTNMNELNVRRAFEHS